MHIIQDILIILLAGYMTIDQNGPVVMSWFSVIVGTISGLIMGDLNTGLMIGGTFQLMSLGVAALGGASAPNYGLATIIGTFIAVRTGTGIDAAVGVGLPVDVAWCGSTWRSFCPKLRTCNNYRYIYRSPHRNGN